MAQKSLDTRCLIRYFEDKGVFAPAGIIAKTYYFLVNSNTDI